jgi:hypothetical protein
LDGQFVSDEERTANAAHYIRRLAYNLCQSAYHSLLEWHGHGQQCHQELRYPAANIQRRR